MALLGDAALMMWWNIDAAVRAEFEDWHTHEHFRERLAIPGFLRASRWRSADDGEGIFVMYELADHAVLSSPAYLARLNAPSPWSTKMMPLHRHMVRTQCRVLASRGPAMARHVLTVRLSPAPGQSDALLAALQDRIAQLVDRPGVLGAHLARHERPAIAATTEQRIRGGDDEADWIFVMAGYDAAALQAVAADVASPAALAAFGALPDARHALFTLSASATPADIG
jgi:quinol monooxygenase YgiN